METHPTTGKEGTKRAVLYRMVTDEHICPYGIKSKWLLEREGFEVEDHHLESRSETDDFKEEHQVETTPQTFIDGVRVGGYDSLREYFGKEATQGEDETSYQPVLAVFGVAAFSALALTWASTGELFALRSVEWFVALSMAMLAMLKLQDVRSFSTMFVSYDMLARRFVPYSFVYPFAEATAAILMMSGALTFISAPIALFIGTIGAASVIKAVWIDGRDVKCACVGGGSNVPLGFVSLTENLAMIAMGLWMPFKQYVLPTL